MGSTSPLMLDPATFTGFYSGLSASLKQSEWGLDVQGEVQNALIKVIPIDFIDNTLNLASWLVLGWILIYGGGKIAEIGVKLIK